MRESVAIAVFWLSLLLWAFAGAAARKDCHLDSYRLGDGGKAEITSREPLRRGELRTRTPVLHGVS